MHRADVAVVYRAGVSVPEPGELLISALGLAMVAALVPQHLMGFILGMWFLTQAAAFLMGVMSPRSPPYQREHLDPLQTLCLSYQRLQ